MATTGGSLAKTVEVVRKNNARVERAVVVVDRQEGAQGKLAEMGVELRSILTASELKRKSG